LLFDGDSAGAKAVEAAHGVLRHEQITSRVAVLPAGDDPDSFLRREGPDALRQRLDAAPGIVEYLIDRAADTCGPSAADRAAAVQSLEPILSLVENSVEERMYLERIAQRFGVDDLRAVAREMQRGRQGPRPQKGPPAGVASPEGSARLPRLQSEVLGILVENPALFETSEAAEVGSFLTHPGLRDIFETAVAQCRETGALDATTLLSSVGDGPAQSWLRGRLAVARPGDQDGGAEALRQGISVLAKRHYQDHERPRLERAIAAARRDGDTGRVDELIRERDELARTYTR
jgi:DNA primase